MSNPITLGVSVEEITKLPHSIALVETAIPAFIGYTEFIPTNYDKPLRIKSLLEYEKYFGKAKKESIQLRDTEKGVTIVAPQVQFLMYYSLQMYFANGGGPCYIISVGNYTSPNVNLLSLQNGLNMIEYIREPILIVFPDAISLTEEIDFYDIYNQAIDKAHDETKNRFVILDTYYGNSTSTSNTLNTIEYFRSEITSTSNAAAYFPHLKTILNYTFDAQATINHVGLQGSEQASSNFYADEIAVLENLKALASNEILSGSPNLFVLTDLLARAIDIVEKINETADEKIELEDSIEILEAIQDGIIDSVDTNFLDEFDDLIVNLIYKLSITEDKVGNANGRTLENLKTSDSLLYNQIKEAMKSLKVILPPSSTIAGVYGKVDSTRGVWKAPANVSLNYVIAPTEKLSDKEQSNLNIDASGKSINAIRSFTGKGTLVWGARTLEGKDKNDDGKDNEWKYVHVRRYYNMVQQLISEALGKFINEPNNIHTWLRAKTMIENFLNQQWKEGALAGSSPKEAYHVKVESGGSNIMNVEIKMALVRPAEFIVLNFSHKL